MLCVLKNANVILVTQGTNVLIAFIVMIIAMLIAVKTECKIVVHIGRLEAE